MIAGIIDLSKTLQSYVFCPFSCPTSLAAPINRKNRESRTRPIPIPDFSHFESFVSGVAAESCKAAIPRIVALMERRSEVLLSAASSDREKRMFNLYEPGPGSS